MAITAGDIVYQIKGDLSNLENAVKKAGKDLKSFGSQVSQVSKNIGTKFTVAGAAITGGFGAAVKTSFDFRKALAEVSTLGVKEMARMEKGIKQVATTFGSDLVETTKGAYQVISATGLDAADATKVLASATKAAKAGVSDISSAVELGAGVMNAYGKEVDDINGIYDQAFIAVKNGVTTFGELSTSVGKLSPVMAAAGFSSEEMFAAITALTKAGIGTAESVTGVKAAMSNIIKPTSDALKVAEKLGIQFNAATLESKGLGGFLAELKEKAGGNVETMAKLFGSVEGLNSVLALTGTQNEAFNQTLTEMQSGVAATGEAFDKMVANDPSYVWGQLRSQMQVLADEIGKALLPALFELSQSAKEVVSRILAWKKENPELFNQIIKVTASVGGIMVVLGPVLIGFGSLVSTFTLVSGSLKLVSTGFTLLKATMTVGTSALGLLLSPAGLVAAAIAGIGWALKELYDNWDWMWPEIKRTYRDVVEYLSKALDHPKEAFEDFLEWVGGWGKGIKETFINLKTEVAYQMTQFKESILGPIAAAKDKMSAFGDTISGWFGHSTWIDYFENLAAKANLNFGLFAGFVKTHLKAATVAMALATPILAQTSESVAGTGTVVLESGETFKLAAKEIEKGGEIILKGGKKAILGSEQIERGGTIVSSSGEVFKVAAAKIKESGQEAGEVVPPEIQKITDSLKSMNSAITQSSSNMDQFVDKHVSGWKKIATAADSLYSGTLGGATRGGTSKIQITGITLAGIVTGAADKVRYSLDEILEMTGKSFSELYREFSEYFQQQIRLWRSGSEVAIVSMEEWANSISGISGTLDQLVAQDFDAMSSTIDRTTDSMIGDLSRFREALEQTTKATSSFHSGSAGSTLGTGERVDRRAAGGRTTHPMVMVGERGPELVALPVGSRVMANDQMKQAVRGFASGGVIDAQLSQAQKAYHQYLASPFRTGASDRGYGASLINAIQQAGNAKARLENGAAFARADQESRRKYQQSLIDRNARLKLASSTSSSSGLRTGIGGIDAALSNRTSGGSVTINGPLIQIDRVDASNSAEVDSFLDKASTALLDRLSSKGLGLNVGYA